MRTRPLRERAEPGSRTLDLMLFRPPFALPWDDLDAQACGDDGAPDWRTMIVVGPSKTRDAYGNTTLQWTVTVQCRPQQS